MWDQTNSLVRPIYGTYKADGAGPGSLTKLLRGKRPIHEDGGPLKLIRAIHTTDELQGVGNFTGQDLRPFGYANKYDGGFVPLWIDRGYSIVDYNDAGYQGKLGPNLDGDVVADHGASAWNRFKPKTHDVDALQFLVELRELPRQLKTTAKGFRDVYKSMRSRKAARELFMPKNLADQFLNEQFGWVPFLSDLNKLYKTYNRYDDRVRTLRKNNGRWLRRGGTVMNVQEESDVYSTGGYAGLVYPQLPFSFYAGYPFVQSTLYSTVERRVWFEGSFKYYLPEFDSDNRAYHGQYGDVMRKARLYGLMVNPEIIYNLTPWTWLIDWFTNVGDNISNVVSIVNERLVARYAYIMNHSRRHVINTSRININGGPRTCIWIQEIESKSRDRASPFGFSLSGSSLTPRQLLILAALGITRA